MLVGLLLTPLLCFGALRASGVTYEAKAMLLLLPPGATVPKAGNPYLNLGSMQPVVGVLSDSMLSQQTALTVKDVSPTATYTVAPDPATSGAVLVVDVTDSTSAGASKVLKTLTTLAPQRLDQLQVAANTPASGRITTDLVAEDTKPIVSHKSQQRAGLLALALGLAATVLGASFVDGLVARRRSRRAANHRTGRRRSSDASTEAEEQSQRDAQQSAPDDSLPESVEPNTDSDESELDVHASSHLSRRS
ncbi:hypothetical protein [Flexivirga oryzae]|uniref:Capsular polysaccharide biosynthesis protein n=1 Tax=Flexivirga oryzae TaxID=1794944 RepID=A0A839N2K7_9MICO|nr:hypothetical protein [Flexivirga oryzae]MBB2890153.1 hypothetical protein [Flexivirga oryzae]